MWWAWIAAGIIILLSIILWTKISITVHVLHAQDNDFIRVTIKAWGILSYTTEIPLLKISDDSASIVIEEETKTGEGKQTAKEKERKITPTEILNQIQKVKDYIEHIINLHVIVKRFLTHVTVRKFEWHSAFGTGDAATTGTFSGALWSLKGGIIGLLAHYMRLNVQPVLQITPHFQELFSRTELICMFSFRVWHAIGAGFRILKYWKNVDIGGEEHVRTSDSRLDDDSNGKLERND
ncbi:DUF2953 domain-containing protein [Bacillus tianshenii]|nr:DUF2953 domain-containing protein [Bacillus tianshenii]